MEKETAMKILKELHDKSLFAERTALETIIPELKKSEDERIRKSIICGMNALKEQGKETFATIPIDDAIAWLEKQGEQKPAVTDFNAKDWYVSKVDGKIHDMTYNPTDKVEPKFKIGDYIVNDYCAGKVVALTDDAYLLDTEQGIPFSCEHNVHLWTIQDAKEGDVLTVERDKTPFIFKEFDKFHPECPVAYCGIDDSGIFVNSDDGWWTDEEVYPATKEQRELLFKKMKEAGYEWDAEKKELKLLITNGGDFEQKQEWSEEDENYLQSAENACEYQYGKNTSTILWLKSLKDRMIWKPSKEQMDALLGIMIESGFDYIDYNTLESLYNDLKKL